MQLIGLNTKFLGRNAIYFKKIDSTQDEIWRLFEKRAENGTLVVADIQTKAKGTHGRIWYTDEEQNIAFSFLIRMHCDLNKINGLTTKIAEVILLIFRERYGVSLERKVPNDIVFAGKKVGGILTESKTIGDKLKCLAIGIGINTMQENFRDEIKNVATSIMKEFNVVVDRDEFIAEFCNRFEKYLIDEEII